MEQVGPGVLAVLEPGQKVALDLVTRCNQCYYCRTGNSNHCENRFKKGQRVLGGFAEYITVKATQVFPVPEEMDLKTAAFSEPVACCIRSLNRIGLSLAEDLLILGAGPMGLMHLQVAVSMGARVFVSDINEKRLQDALDLGAAGVVNPENEDVIDYIKKKTNGTGADACVITTPAHSALETAFGAVSKSGRINIYTSYGDTPALPVDANKLHRSEYLVTGSEGRTAEDFLTSVRLLSFGKVKVDTLISMSIPFERIDEGMKAAASSDTYRGTGKPRLERMLFVIDIGTTSLKAALFDTTGELKRAASVPIGFVKADNNSYHEVDPGQWVPAAGRAFREVSGGERVTVEAVAVSGNGPTLVPVDRNGEPLGNAMSWMDRRGVKEAEAIKAAAGYYVDPTFYLPKALWIRNKQPEVFARVTHFMACPEFMIYRLTGKAHTILPGDDFLMYFWTEKLLEDLNLDKDLFPDFVDPGAFCGSVRTQASTETGIPEGTPVFAGGPDFVMSMLGTASVYPGRACDRAGTSEGINLCTTGLVRDDRLLGYGHVIKGLYNVSGIISTSGKALEWVMGLLGMEDDYPGVFSEASHVPAGSEGPAVPALSRRGARTPLGPGSARFLLRPLALSPEEGPAEGCHGIGRVRHTRCD